MEKENRKTNLVSWQLSRLKDVRSFPVCFSLRNPPSPFYLKFPALCPDVVKVGQNLHLSNRHFLT